jgi:hypothetical protein
MIKLNEEDWVLLSICSEEDWPIDPNAYEGK